MTPMVDVVLCLLVFFMAATRLYDWDESQFVVKVPEVAAAAPLTAAPDDLALAVLAPGKNHGGRNDARPRLADRRPARGPPALPRPGGHRPRRRPAQLSGTWPTCWPPARPPASATSASPSAPATNEPRPRPPRLDIHPRRRRPTVHDSLQWILNLLDAKYVVTIGYWLMTLIVFTETGLLIGFCLPGDSLLVTAGIFAAEGKLNILLVNALLIPAAILGDTLGYWIGYHSGPASLQAREVAAVQPRTPEIRPGVLQ